MGKGWCTGYGWETVIIHSTDEKKISGLVAIHCVHHRKHLFEDIKVRFSEFVDLHVQSWVLKTISVQPFNVELFQDNFRDCRRTINPKHFSRIDKNYFGFR